MLGAANISLEPWARDARCTGIFKPASRIDRLLFPHRWPGDFVEH